jgi:hypothetical protein
MEKFYSTYRKEFSQESVWRDSLGYTASLMVYNDPEFGSLDARETIPAGSSVWRCLVSKGIGTHVYGAATSRARRN